VAFWFGIEAVALRSSLSASVRWLAAFATTAVKRVVPKMLHLPEPLKFDCTDLTEVEIVFTDSSV
jgi:hypothetical protein